MSFKCWSNKPLRIRISPFLHENYTLRNRRNQNSVDQKVKTIKWEPKCNICILSMPNPCCQETQRGNAKEINFGISRNNAKGGGGRMYVDLKPTLQGISTGKWRGGGGMVTWPRSLWEGCPRPTSDGWEVQYVGGSRAATWEFWKQSPKDTCRDLKNAACGFKTLWKLNSNQFFTASLGYCHRKSRLVN